MNTIAKIILTFIILLGIIGFLMIPEHIIFAVAACLVIIIIPIIDFVIIYTKLGEWFPKKD